MPNIDGFLTDKEILALQKRANDIRIDIIEMLLESQSGHSAGSLGMADIFTVLYFEILNIDPKRPTFSKRDRLVLSNGHIAPVLYTTLAHRGFFSRTKLKTLRKINSQLQGHPHNLSLPGVENSSGPLGQGISQAVGMALSALADNAPNPNRVYCISSDGELQEGQTWEAAMSAPNLGLTNLTWIIDRNQIQLSGYTEKLMPLEPLADKLEAFNWNVIDIDGHNISEIHSALLKAKSVKSRPTVIIAHTIPGKGADFMEYKFEWHGKAPNKKEAEMALKQLRSLGSHLKTNVK